MVPIPNLWSVCDHQFGRLCSIPSPRLEAIDCIFLVANAFDVDA
jgi:hypothetical protein